MVRKTVAEKRGDDIRKAANFLKKARLNLNRKKIPNKEHFGDAFVFEKLEDDRLIIEVDKRKLKGWSKEVGQGFNKVSGVSALWLSEYLLRMLNSVFVDNKLIEALERASRNSSTTKVGRKLSWVESYLLYYVFAASVVFSGTHLGIKGAEDNKDDKKDEKKEVVINNEKKGSYDKKLKKIDPQESNFVQQALNEYWPVLAVGLTELETYRGVPKLQGSEARSTNGLGVTYTYYYNEKGILYRVANPKNAEKVRTFDVAGNYEQCKRHLTYETLPKLGNAIKRKENITAQQSVALVLAGYQRPSDMDNIALRLSKAKTKQEIADAFAYYPGSTKYKEGTLKRRWWCAAYATGVITMQDFIDLPRDGFSNIELSNVYKDGHFVLTNEAVQYALKTAKTGKRSTVKDFLNSFETGQEILNDVNSVSSKTVALDEAARQIRKQNARGDLLYGVEKTLV